MILRRLSLLGLLFTALTSYAEAEPVTLPEAIKSSLDQDFPGWKLAQTGKGEKNLIIADFDHNGLQDCAMEILIGAPEQPEQVLLVSLQDVAGFHSVVLQSRVPDPDISIDLLKRSVVMTKTGGGQDQLTQRVILRTVGAPEGDSLFTYEDGRFKETSAAADENPQ